MRAVVKRVVTPAVIVTAATASYSANCLLGTAVAAGLLDTSGRRWVHHALYASTYALTVGAVSSLTWSDSSAGRALLPALLPLTAISVVRRGRLTHAVIGLAAAPAFAAAVARARR